MKAISLWQPWASLIATGAKRIETRHWRVEYTGPLLIHAAKRIVKREFKELAEYPEYCRALGMTLKGYMPDDEEEVEAYQKLLSLPFGAIVAVADLVDCRKTESFTRDELHADRGGWSEYDLGDYSSHRYGWMLENIRPIVPYPYKGEQGLFDVPEIVKIQEALSI